MRPDQAADDEDVERAATGRARSKARDGAAFALAGRFGHHALISPNPPPARNRRWSAGRAVRGTALSDAAWRLRQVEIGVAAEGEAEQAGHQQAGGKPAPGEGGAPVRALRRAGREGHDLRVAWSRPAQRPARRRHRHAAGALGVQGSAGGDQVVERLGVRRPAMPRPLRWRPRPAGPRHRRRAITRPAPRLPVALAAVATAPPSPQRRFF